MKVQVSRDGVTVRAREIFDVRDLRGSRLGGALAARRRGAGAGDRARAARHELPVRRSRTNPERRRLLVTGEASRVAGRRRHAPSGRERPRPARRSRRARSSCRTRAATCCRSRPTSRSRPATTSCAWAIMDGAGRVGSVDHRVDAQDVHAGRSHRHRSDAGRACPTARRAIRASRSTASGRTNGSRSRSISKATATWLDRRGRRVRDRLDRRRPGAGAFAGRALADPRAGAMLAQGVADMRVLPPGDYFARAKVTQGNDLLGEVRRAFTVLRRCGSTAGAAGATQCGVEPRLRASRPACRS